MKNLPVPIFLISTRLLPGNHGIGFRHFLLEFLYGQTRKIIVEESMLNIIFKIFSYLLNSYFGSLSNINTELSHSFYHCEMFHCTNLL